MDRDRKFEEHVKHTLEAQRRMIEARQVYLGAQESRQEAAKPETGIRHPPKA
jgi:hypothetical protein